MATWQDGPEYAPAERPNAFAPPAETRPLDQAPPRRTPSTEAPYRAPGGYAEPEQVEPLDHYHPDRGPQRDPQEPYAVARSAMTGVDSEWGAPSAWGTVHDYHVQPLPPGQWAPPTGLPAAPPDAHDPRAPILVRGAPSPQSLPTTVPGPPGPAPAPPAPIPGQPGPATQPEWLTPEQSDKPSVGAADVIEGMTLPTILTLLVGGTAILVPLFGWVSPLMFLLAFGTSTQIAYRRNWVRNTFLVAAGALGTTSVLSIITSPSSLLTSFALIYQVSTVICWIVMLTLTVIVWHALSNGEPPDLPTKQRTSGWN